MQASVFAITDRRRERLSHVSSFQDFTVARAGSIAASVVVESPVISLYCLDDKSKQAIFVEGPSGADLAAAPFVYQAQYEQAQRLIAVPYAIFIELAGSLDTNPDRLILLFNIGRCGSTLLHHVFNQAPGVVCLSEPDAMTQFIHWRKGSAGQDAALLPLFCAVVRFLFKPAAYPDAPTCAIKFRNQSVELIDFCAAAFPQAKRLFLYRDAIGWCASIYRLITRSGPPELISIDEAMAWLNAHHGRVIDLDTLGLGHLQRPVTVPERLAISWLIMLQCYLDMTARGFSMPAYRYNELNRQRRETVTALFAECGLPVNAAPAALQAFGRDSQEGTPLARAQGEAGAGSKLTGEQITEIERILAYHPRINHPDFILPGTVFVTAPDAPEAT